MTWQGPEFVIAIIALSTIGWVITSWIRARHGYPVEGEWGGIVHKIDPEAERAIQMLTSENEQLNAKLLGLQDRVAVLERLATDHPARLSAEIDQLR